MTKQLFPSLFLLLAFVVLLPTQICADTFEFLTYTPPPSGWTKQMSADGPVYRRNIGIGLISFYASYPTTGTAADEFAKTWQLRIGTALSLQAPQPKIETDGEYKIAVGAQNVNAQGTMTAISLVTIVGRGRAINFSSVTAGNDALREVGAFFDSIKITSGAAAPNSGAVPTGAIEVDFEVPPGYTSQRDAGMVILKPTMMDRSTPCVYGISPSRVSSGNLEADARTALLEPLPGWQVKSDHYNAMRGSAGAGWPYYWFRTDVQKMSGGSMQYLTAMSMAFSGGQGRVNIFWGFGSTGVCTADDLTFLRLFFSLRPRGYTSDGGKALARELNGLWRDTQNRGLAQYKFLPDGRYDYGLGTSTTFGNLETTTGSVGAGHWELRGSDLTLTGRRAGKYRVRVYDEFVGGVWRRAMSLLNESANPPSDVQYMRIDES
ncbi:MAG TPA: hypothetical protein VMZ26_11460 [Pyrinomonadaceae bacterium]|nr:hypothetical protein [Pyrinomonadaceae bacterium]